VAEQDVEQLAHALAQQVGRAAVLRPLVEADLDAGRPQAAFQTRRMLAHGRPRDRDTITWSLARAWAQITWSSARSSPTSRTCAEPGNSVASDCRRLHSLSLTSDERVPLKELEGENRELRRANEILRKACAYLAQAELDRRPK
jgi:transposase-like protein